MGIHLPIAETNSADTPLTERAWFIELALFSRCSQCSMHAHSLRLQIAACTRLPQSTGVEPAGTIVSLRDTGGMALKIQL